MRKKKCDHSKYYLSYPKPRILDMKWETSDIDVVERTNNDKFSKLDNGVTSFRLLELFFDDVLVDMTVGYTKLYSHREKADISFETTNEKIWLFLSMLLLSGCHRFQTVKYIGGQPPPPIQCLIQCIVILSSILFGISIFVTTNNLINKTNSWSFFARLMTQ